MADAKKTEAPAEGEVPKKKSKLLLIINHVLMNEPAALERCLRALAAPSRMERAASRRPQGKRAVCLPD